MTKRVRYNGGTKSYYGCSDPNDLVMDQEYEVVCSRDRGWQTDYILKGVIGEFNAEWFDEISFEDKVYVAVSHDVPVLGQRYNCYKIEFKGNRINPIGVSTSIVKGINYMGNNIYKVTTCNRVYIVNVG